MTTTWIKNTTYLHGKGFEVTQGDLLIQNGRIVGITPPQDHDLDRVEVIDGKNYLVTPGLINTHTHVAMTLFRGYAGGVPLGPWLEEYIWPAEAKLTDEDVAWGTKLGILEMLAAGVTCFADMYDHMETVAYVVAESGIRANLCRGMIGMADPQHRGLEENDRLYESWHGAANHRIQVTYGPHAPNTCPPDYLRKVADHAQDRQAGIHIHLAETQDEMDFCLKAYGKTPTQVCLDAGLFEGPCLAAHGIHLLAEDQETLRQYGVAIAHNPVSNMKLASGACSVIDLRRRGLTLGLGTDGSSSNNNLSVLKEMQVTALMQKHLHQDAQAIAAKDVLAMATWEGASALGIEGEVGTIEIGKKADLVFWDLDKPHWTPINDYLENFLYAAQGSDVSLTMVDGKILYRKGEFFTLDQEKVMAEAGRTASKLLA